jgi:hypothetical protein
MLLFLLGPPLISHVIRVTTAFAPTLEINHEDLWIVPGGRFISGFLVLPNAAELPREVPALHASTFAEMIPAIFKTANPLYIPVREARLLSELLPQVPFAFVFGPAQNKPDIGYNYLTPSAVLADVPRRWVFQLNTIVHIQCSVRLGIMP